jgi:hypothetical protein
MQRYGLISKSWRKYDIPLINAAEAIIPREIRIKRRTLAAVLPTIIIAVSWLLIATPEQRYVVLPIVIFTIIVLWFWITLWNRDRELPLFDVGVIYALALLAYTNIPLLNYISGGFRFTEFSDARLQFYHPTPYELGFFHWRHVIYIFSFVVMYIIIRGKRPAKLKPAKIPRPSMLLAIILLLLLFTGYLILLNFLTNYYLGSRSYKEMHAMYTTGGQVQLPLLVRQISHYFEGMWFIFKLALMMFVIQHCHRRKWRIILYVWLAVEVAICIQRLGSRTEIVMLLMAAGLLYHRLVKPLTPRFILITGLLLLTGFFAYGIVRANSMRTTKLQDIYPETSFLSHTNEFQAILGTSYDLYQRRQKGSLQVPWQLYVSDFLMLVPQQICPVEKIDPSQWYLGLLGQQNTGVGFMFGVISQAIVGWDWLELAIRGAILGFILAQIHRWYLRNSSSFFVVLFYTWLCIRIYYTYRASTFYPLVFVVYEIVPAFFLIKTLPGLLRFLRPSRNTVEVHI